MAWTSEDASYFLSLAAISATLLGLSFIALSFFLVDLAKRYTSLVQLFLSFVTEIGRRKGLRRVPGCGGWTGYPTSNCWMATHWLSS
jgi:hypothetical protein